MGIFLASFFLFFVTSASFAAPNQCYFGLDGGVETNNCVSPNVCPSGVFINSWQNCVPPFGSPTVSIPTTVPTELGNLRTDPEGLLQQVVKILVGVAGGVSLILLFIGAGKYMLSLGNPEGIEDAKATITHAVMGVLLVFLSVFLIRFIGIDVLAIPGLTSTDSGGVTTP